MITDISKEEQIYQKKEDDLACLLEKTSIQASAATTDLAELYQSNQFLLTSKPLVHRAESGLNPLVDAAAYLFSTMGKLKQLKSYKNLGKLHDELIQEIESFQETLRENTYNDEFLEEYIPISCYVLCVTLDDIIANTPWGGHGRWDKYNLMMTFSQEPLSTKSFLIILERLVRDPAVYIDVMEFIYICLSLGFKCHYNSSEMDYMQLEQIMDSLYKRIRAHRGNFTKVLSPFAVKARPASVAPSALLSQKLSRIGLGIAAMGVIVSLFAGGAYFFKSTFSPFLKSLTQTELGAYEQHNQLPK